VDAVVAVAAVLVAVVVYLGGSQRSDFEIARTLHLDLTSGEVARARDLLGVLMHGTAAQISRLDKSDARTAYFTLLWCFERILNGRRALVQGKLLRRRSRAVRFLDEALAWHLDYWAVGVDLIRAPLTAILGEEVDDKDSRLALAALLAESGS